MDQRTRPAPRVTPLPSTHSPDLKDVFDAAIKRLGFIPNSVLIMQRKPKMAKAYTALAASIWDPEGEVPLALKRLMAFLSSRVAGCQYCTAHTGEVAHNNGVEQTKLDAVWEYQTSPLFSAAERAALDLAVAASCVPNATTDEMFLELRKYWNDNQIVEIVGVIALFGFLNRWNDTMATPLEDNPIAYGEKHLTKAGWSAEKHLR